MKPDRTFVDISIFVYADDASAGAKRDRAQQILAPLMRAHTAVISTQVIQEYFVTATKKLHLPPERARWRVEGLARLEVVVIRPEHIVGAIDLHRLHSVSFWDALVIKCASVSGCAVLLSEDLSHGQTIDGVRIENPFLPATGASEPRLRYQVPRRRTPRSRQATP